MKFRVPRSFLSVAIVALLASMGVIIEVPCPACSGTGTIVGAVGVEVGRVEYELIDSKYFDAWCVEEWAILTYDVSISVENKETTRSLGYIVVAFYDPPGEDTTQVRRYRSLVYIDIPPGAVDTIQKVLVYAGGAPSDVFRIGVPQRLEVETAKDIECPICDGTGKVPITEWLRIKAGVE